MEQSQIHDIGGMPGVAGHIPDVAGHIPDVVDDISDNADEKARTITRPGDTTLLDLIERATPQLAIDFLNEARPLTQTGLDTALTRACQYGFKYLVQKLVELGADIECRDKSGRTPLLICVENCYFDLVRFLVARKADMTVVDIVGNNALIISISFAGSREMTQFLLQQADVMIHHQNQDGCTAVMKALEVMDVGVVHMLLEHLSHTYNNDSGWTLLDQTVNCKGETAQQIAEKYGLGSLFTLLKECLPKKSSLIQAAVGSCDLETVNLLLDSDIVEKYDMGVALLQLFRKYGGEEVTTFTKEEVTMIKRLVECGADCNIVAKKYRVPWLLSLAVDVGVYRLVEVFCKHGASLNQPIHGNEDLPLSVAAKHGRLDLMELLLQYNAEVNTNSFNHSPLDCALIHGQINCARLLVLRGAKLDITLALTSAVKNQAPEYMKFLFQHYENLTIKYILEKPKNGNNLFVDAVRGCNLEIIEHILHAGVDINEPQSSGATPIVESKNGAVAQFLIFCGADVNHTTNRTKRTPLMHVLLRLSNRERMGRIDDCIEEVILVLLENGADANARTSNGRTPLMLVATVSGQEEILQLLLDHGADCAARDNKGNTALIHATMARCSHNAIFLIQFMENNTDQLNVQNNSSITALMYSVYHRGWDIASKLIENGADVNITDMNGNTVLFLAMSDLIGESFLENLIRAGCDVNHQNNAGVSPLMLEVKRCKFTSTVPLLLASGADVNAVNHKDTSKTALSYFTVFKHLQMKAITCLEALLDKGADASYLSPCFLGTIISRSPYNLIPKLIRCGLAPFDNNFDEMSLWVKDSVLTLPSVSPLCLAVLAGNVTLARYFWENLFLTNLDLSLASNNDVRLFLERKVNFSEWYVKEYEECLSFLDEIGSQPMSLLKICLVVVSSAVGASPGREARVNELPLPCLLKDTLLFKSEVVNLAQPEDRDDNTSMPVGAHGLGPFYQRFRVGDDHDAEDGCLKLYEYFTEYSDPYSDTCSDTYSDTCSDTYSGPYSDTYSDTYIYPYSDTYSDTEEEYSYHAIGWLNDY